MTTETNYHNDAYASSSIGKLPISSLNGMLFLDHTDISHITANGSYTLIHCDNGSQHIISKNLHTVERYLPVTFFRCHHSHIIHLIKVVRFLRTSGYRVELNNGVQIEVSRRRKTAFMEAMKRY